MNDKKGVSIFIIPVFILSLSIISTFLKSNTNLHDIYSGAQIANPLITDSSQEASDLMQEASDETPPDTRDSAEETSKETTKSTDKESTSKTSDTKTDTDTKTPSTPTKTSTPKDTSPTPSPSSSNQGTTSSATQGDTAEQSSTSSDEETPEEDADVLAEKQVKFELSRQGLATRFQITLANLEQSQSELTSRIALKREAGQDTSIDEEKLAEVKDAIREVQVAIRNSTLPDTIPGLARGLITYIIEVREAITQALNAIREASSVIQ